MLKQKLVQIIRAILERPTAPFHESQVAEEILSLLKKCPHVGVERDDFGNLIAHFRRGKARPRHAFVAHMDHPGWVRMSAKGARSGGSKKGPRTAKQSGPDVPRFMRDGVTWQFFGTVPERYLANPKIKQFGEFAMWDLPALDVRDGIIHSRACDDLIGCATIVAMFYELEKTGGDCSCMGIFTRAEEVGFVGAIKLAESGVLPKSLTVVSLETSSERPPARMGDGPIIRVGDRASIFDSSATAEFVQIAASSKITVQRCLMPGGTCEATAFQLHGYRTAAMCVALGNYHNCGSENTIAAEFVSLNDVKNLAHLCARVAATRDLPPPEKALRKRLDENVKKYRAYF